MSQKPRVEDIPVIGPILKQNAEIADRSASEVEADYTRVQQETKETLDRIERNAVR